MPRWSRVAALLLAAAALACRGASETAEESAEAPLPLDSLTPSELETLAPDPLRYPEMQGGRLDTVDMRSETPDALWEVQVINYADSHIAITYAFSYSGPDSATMFAADGQPRLEDNLGNVYQGVVVPDNPRLEIESGATGLGVYLFSPGLAQRADSLTLFINDSTPPILRIGPWGVFQAPSDGAPGQKEPSTRLQTGG